MKTKKIFAVTISLMIVFSTMVFNVSAAEKSEVFKTTDGIELPLIPASVSEGNPGEIGDAVGSETTVTDANGKSFKVQNYTSGCTIKNDAGWWRIIVGAKLTDGKLDFDIDADKALSGPGPDNAFAENANQTLGSDVEDLDPDGIFEMIKAEYNRLLALGYGPGALNGNNNFKTEVADKWENNDGDDVYVTKARYATGVGSTEKSHYRQFITYFAVGKDGKVYSVYDEFADAWAENFSKLGAPKTNSGKISIDGQEVDAQIFEYGYLVKGTETVTAYVYEDSADAISEYDVKKITFTSGKLTMTEDGKWETSEEEEVSSEAASSEAPSSTEQSSKAAASTAASSAAASTAAASSKLSSNTTDGGGGLVVGIIIAVVVVAGAGAAFVIMKKNKK